MAPPTTKTPHTKTPNDFSVNKPEIDLRSSFFIAPVFGIADSARSDGTEGVENCSPDK